MNNFQITEIINSNTIRVSPFWEMEYNGHTYSGDKINVRGMEGLNDNEEVINRLKKILIGNTQELSLVSPEPIEYKEPKNAIVSCSIYIGQDNVVYYFPEFVSKY